jgi:hypothetical protein
LLSQVLLEMSLMLKKFSVDGDIRDREFIEKIRGLPKLNKKDMLLELEEHGCNGSILRQEHISKTLAYINQLSDGTFILHVCIF